MPAQYLLRQHSGFQAFVGQKRLHHRRKQLSEALGTLITLVFGVVELHAGEKSKRATTVNVGSLGEQHTSNIRMHQQRIRFSVWVLCPGSRTTLNTVLGVSSRMLIRQITGTQTLQANAEAFIVHHSKHRSQPLMLFSKQKALGAVVINHRRCAAIDTHLVLKRAAGPAVAQTQATIGFRYEFRHDKQRNPLGAVRAVHNSRQGEVHNIFSHIVLTAGNENFRAGDAVGTVGLGFSLGSHHAQICTGMRLG